MNRRTLLAGAIAAPAAVTALAQPDITYAKVDGPPADWFGLEIIDLATGARVDKVVEVNALEGWLVRIRHDAEGQPIVKGGELVRERLTGRFRIQRPAANL